MLTPTDAKAIARVLARTTTLTHSQVLEAVAQAAGDRDWNTFVARTQAPVPAATDDIARQQVVPILRVFDAELARRFYVDLLGFEWQWEHRFEPGFPLYAQVARAGTVLHLSEHHGDATPGSAVMIVVDDLAGYRDRIHAHPGTPVRPGIEEQGWGLTMTVTDPFGNRLVFWQRESGA